MKYKLLIGSLITIFSSVSYAAPTTIDFDTLGSGVSVGSTYSAQGVTFSNATTIASTVCADNCAGSTSPTVIRSSSDLYNPTQASPIIATFDMDVSFVSLTGIDVGTDGFILSVFDIFDNLIASDTAFGTTTAGVGEFFTLSLSGSGIRKVAFSQENQDAGLGDGMVFDNFTYDTASVPEASSILLLGLGLAGLGFTRRKKVL